MADFPALDLRWRSGPGVPETCELLHARLDEFEPQAILDNEAADGWRVFFKTPRQRDAAVAAVAAMQASCAQLLAVDAVDVPDEEWARRSQANLGAIRVGRILVAPPWQIPAPSHFPPAADVLIVIDPSTGFGTGHHETTRLCLSLLQNLALGGRRVIDVGTGSGVLAIAAAKLGASAVVAIDEDPEALRNAAENVFLNHVSGVVDIREVDLGSFDGQSGDVVVANLTGAVIQKHSARLVQLVGAGGTLIVSGFSTAESADVARALALNVECEAAEGDWAAVVFRTGQIGARR